jgi:superfamily II DNA or RNA helicase
MKCLDEGVDVPATKTAFFIASTTNPKEFIQRRGRVLRKAKGKKRANIYDFIVVPSPETPEAVAQYLLEREMPRFAEFSDLAENKYRARDVLRPILDRYEMLHLLDLKPWDVYHRQNPESRDQQ